MVPTHDEERSAKSRLTWQHNSLASLIREKTVNKEPVNLASQKQDKEKPPYGQIVLSGVLFLTICIMVSMIYHYYYIHIMSVFIFDRIKIVEVNRSMEILNFNENGGVRTPLAKIRLGVEFPLRTTHTDCTEYLNYLIAIEGDNRRRHSRKKRSIEHPNYPVATNSSDTLPIEINTTSELTQELKLGINKTSVTNQTTNNFRKKKRIFLRQKKGVPHQENSTPRPVSVYNKMNDKIIYDVSGSSDGVHNNLAEEFHTSPKFGKHNQQFGAAAKYETGMKHNEEEITSFQFHDERIEEDSVHQDLFSEMQCIDYKNQARLQLTHRPPLPDVDCFSVHWESSSAGLPMKDCFVMDNNATGVWWGLGDVTGGAVPLSRIGSVPEISLYTGEIQRHRIGGLLRRVWISSKGVMVTIPFASKASLSVEFSTDDNAGEFCLTSQERVNVNHFDRESKPTLDYTLCTGKTVKSLLSNLREVERMDEVEYRTSKWHRSLHQPSHDVLRRPPFPLITSETVNAVMERFNCPIWRPWLSHNQGAIDQDDVLAYAESIATNRMRVCGHVLLPVSWQEKLGNLEFDKKRFPAPKVLVETLLRKGLRLALTLSPLIDTETQRFKNSTIADLLITQINSTLPILVSTNRATAAGVLDFTNPNTVTWFADELRSLKEEYGIDRFHISPVNTQSLPPFRHHHSDHENPDYALSQFLSSVSRIKEPISTDVSIIPVNPPTFLTAGYGDAGWGMLEMLPNRIMSISAVGGNLVDSGVVGGWSNQKGHIPDRELFLRWMEVSIFLPAMQVSALPTMYDKMLQSLAVELIQLRQKFVIPRLRENLNETLTNGYPLISPLAFIFPKDSKCLSVTDQWIVGKDLLVAPVLKRGRRARDVYLPPGIWKDGLDERLLKGKRWLRGYVVSLGKVPHFFLITPEKGNKGQRKKQYRHS